MGSQVKNLRHQVPLGGERGAIGRECQVRDKTNSKAHRDVFFGRDGRLALVIGDRSDVRDSGVVRGHQPGAIEWQGSRSGGSGDGEAPRHVGFSSSESEANLGSAADDGDGAVSEI